jgi:hypothetical protein
MIEPRQQSVYQTMMMNHMERNIDNIKSNTSTCIDNATRRINITSNAIGKNNMRNMTNDINI